jgi:hypothetical protein
MATTYDTSRTTRIGEGAPSRIRTCAHGSGGGLCYLSNPGH